MSDKPNNYRSLKWVPRIGEFVEKNLSLLEQLGIKKSVGAVMSAAMLAVATWLWNNITWYAALGIFLIAVYIILGIIHRVQLIRTASKFDTKAYKELGHELVNLSTEIFRFMADRQRDLSEQHRQSPSVDGSSAINQWNQDRDFESVTGRLFFERFGAQVLGSLALLQKIGVQTPLQMISSAHYRPEGLPRFLALMGNMLSQGYIAEAVEISQDQDFIWRIEH